MSKDKGSKNHKKSPADKSAGKKKKLSAYQAENQSGRNGQPSLEVFTPKPGDKNVATPKGGN